MTLRVHFFLVTIICSVPMFSDLLIKIMVVIRFLGSTLNINVPTRMCNHSMFEIFSINIINIECGPVGYRLIGYTVT